MKSRTSMWMTALSLLAALAMPIGMAAQDNPSPDHKPKHKKYKVIDLGTLGGAQSTVNDVTQGLNNQGLLVGESETTVSLSPVSNFFVCQPYSLSTNISHAFAWQAGTVHDLGALAPAGNNCSLANWISANGQIAGGSENGVVDPLLGVSEIRAVLWGNGQIRDLGTFGGTASFSQSVNNRGQVVGFALNTVPDPFSIYGFFVFGSSGSTQTRGFLWQDGKMHDLGTLGGPDSIAIVINDAGQVAGNSYTNSIPNNTTGLPTIDPFFWQNGKITDVGTLGGVFGLVNSMNNRGQVVGFSDLAGDLSSHAFLWDKRGLKDLGTFGGSNSEARWINESGEAVGAADFDDQFHDAVIWKNGKMTDLGNLGATSYAHANNNNGQVVGATRLQFGPNSSATIHAFLWENGGPMVDLNDLVPANSALILEYGDMINDRGMIAGTATPPGCNDVDDGCGHAFLLIPDGDSDADNEARIAARRHNADLMRQNTTSVVTERAQPSLSPIERLRSMMRQRHYLPGQPAAPRD